MSRPRYGIKLLGLCVLVLAVMAIGASGAQGEAGSHWNVAGAPITGEQPVQATLENNQGSLLSKALGVSFRIPCAAELEEFVLKTAGSSLGRIKYTDCEIYINGVLSIACLPHTGPENDVILTELLKDLITLHQGQPVDVFEPEVGTLLALIHTGPECALGSSIPVSGKFTLRDSSNEGTVEKVVHLAVELAALTELFIISKTNEHKATLDGSANVSLTGANKGKSWSGTPA